MTVLTSANKAIIAADGMKTSFGFSFNAGLSQGAPSPNLALSYLTVLATDANGNITTVTQGAGTNQCQITLNAPDGQWRAVLAGSNQPSLSLSPDGRAANAALMTRDDGTGSVLLRDALGRPRFRAP